MKLQGKTKLPPNREIVVFPHQDGESVFVAETVSDYVEFNKLCPEPQAPVKMFPGGEKQIDVTNPDYLKKRTDWAEKRMDYMAIKSLQPTEDLEFETVKLNDPETYKNWKKELKDFGFNDYQTNMIHGAILDANSLNVEKLEAARESFLARTGAKPKE